MAAKLNQIVSISKFSQIEKASTFKKIYLPFLFVKKGRFNRCLNTGVQGKVRRSERRVLLRHRSSLPTKEHL